MYSYFLRHGHHDFPLENKFFLTYGAPAVEIQESKSKMTLSEPWEILQSHFIVYNIIHSWSLFFF